MKNDDLKNGGSQCAQRAFTRFFTTVALASLSLTLVHCASDELVGLTTRDSSKTDPAALASEEIASAGRALASTDGKLEQSFTKLMNTPQASEYIHQELNRVEILHALSDGYLKSFDVLLDKALQTQKLQSSRAQFLENEPYAQLLASHRLLDATETRLNYFLFRAMETKWSEDVRPDHKQSAVQLVEHFRYNLERRADAYAQTAVQEIAEGFEHAAAQARASYLSQYQGEPPVGLARELVPVLSLIKQRLAAHPNQSPLNSVPAASTDARAQVAKDVALMASQISADWVLQKAQSAGRSTASISSEEKSAEGAFANGPIDGQSFKASTWALTFDGGPSIHDDAILRELKDHHAAATFFWNAQNVLDQKDQVRAARAAGMNLGNHSFTNYDFRRSDATPERIQHEIADSTAAETTAFGMRPKLFRCPYDSCLQIDAAREALDAQKLIAVKWNVDGVDWIDHDVESVYSRIQKQMKLQKRGIVVLRDTHAMAAPVAAHLLRDIAQDESSRIVTIQQVIDESNDHPPSAQNETQR